MGSRVGSCVSSGVREGFDVGIGVVVFSGEGTGEVEGIGVGMGFCLEVFTENSMSPERFATTLVVLNQGSM